MIISVSDVHLGIKRCNKPVFSKFLDWVSDQGNISDLVLNGDIIDLWRRDMVGVMIENADIISKFIDLSNTGTKIHYIAGNHDYVVRHLDIFPNRFNFVKDLTLTRGGVDYKFNHGWEFDRIQNEIYFDALCHTNTRQANYINRTWELYLKYVGPFKYPIELMKKWWAKRDLEKMVLPPEARGLRGTPEWGDGPVRVNGTVTVRGHSHIPLAPFWCVACNVWHMNTGSWVQGYGDVQNTYAIIEDDKIELRRFI